MSARVIRPTARQRAPSHWDVAPSGSTSAEPAEPAHVHHVSHLEAIQIRNLTALPIATAAAEAPGPGAAPSAGRVFAQDDTDLVMLHRASTAKRKRASSSASLKSASTFVPNRTALVVPEEQDEEDAGKVSTPMRNRSSSKASIVSNGSSASTIRPSVMERKRTLSFKRQLSAPPPIPSLDLPVELLDSFITLSCPAPPEPTSPESTFKKPSRPRSLTASSTYTPPPPFFVSPPVKSSLNPGFDVDAREFLLSCPEERDACAIQDRVVIGIWVRHAKDWSLVKEWDVDLDALVCLGRDPRAFPSFPENALILKLHDEYYTPPLPRRRRRRPPNRSQGDQHRPLPHLSSSSSSGSSSEEEAGNQSDPGVLTLKGGRSKSGVRQKTRWEMEEMELRRRKGIVEMSRRETRMVKPEGVDDVVRLIALKHELRETREDIQTLDERLAPLLAETGTLTLTRAKNEARDKADDLTAVLAEMVLDLDDERAALSARKRALKARADRLQAARSLLTIYRRDLDDARQEMSAEEQTYTSILSATHSQRTQLITLLDHLFPIVPSTSPTSSSLLLFTIHSLPLPNSSFPPSLTLSDDVISSALGYAALVVLTLAAYVGVPLHYPIQFRGSRSAVVDPISVMRGPRVFPLYGKGVDRYRWDYGVFLLNKDIEQLMYSQGLTVPDLRNTLPNLKSLILSLSFDPSHEQFSRSTLAHPPSILAPSSPNPELTDDILEPFQAPLPSSSASLLPHQVSSSSSSEESGATDSSPRTEGESNTSLEDEMEDEMPMSPDGVPNGEENVDEGGEGGTQSPSSTLKAHSVRSVSPAPTLKASSSGSSSTAASSGVGKIGSSIAEKANDRGGGSKMWRVAEMLRSRLTEAGTPTSTGATDV